MGKFYGKIFYGKTVEREDRPGSWKTQLVARDYYGDITRMSRRYSNDSNVNGDITCNNVISIIADPYAVAHFSQIKCVELVGTKWTVTSVEVQSPRLILTLGGVYNGS